MGLLEEEDSPRGLPVSAFPTSLCGEKRVTRMGSLSYFPPYNLHAHHLKGNTMKVALLFLACLLVFSTGCKKDSTNPLAPPAAPQPDVTFTMHMESGTQGMIFIASPNADVKLTKVEVSYPAENFTDTITNPNPEAVIAKNSNIQLNEYTGINTHQQWVLVFHGSLAATGKQFVITVNWDVV
jgi:hypothetical protein